MVLRRSTAIQRTIRSNARACIYRPNVVLEDESTMIEGDVDTTYFPKKGNICRSRKIRQKKKDDDKEEEDMGPDPAEMERLVGEINQAEDFSLVYETVETETYVYKGKVKRGNVVDSSLNGSQTSDSTIKTISLENTVVYTDGSSAISYSQEGFANVSTGDIDVFSPNADDISDRTLLGGEDFNDNLAVISNKENMDAISPSSPFTKKRRTHSLVGETSIEYSKNEEQCTSSQEAGVPDTDSFISVGYRTPPSEIPDDPAINELIKQTAMREGGLHTPFTSQDLSDVQKHDEERNGRVGQITRSTSENKSHGSNTPEPAHNSILAEGEIGTITNETIKQTTRSSFLLTHSALSEKSEQHDDVFSQKQSTSAALTSNVYTASQVTPRPSIDTRDVSFDGLFVPLDEEDETMDPTSRGTSAVQDFTIEVNISSPPCLNSTQSSSPPVFQLDQSPILRYVRLDRMCDGVSLSACRALSKSILSNSRNEANGASRSRLSTFVQSCIRHSQCKSLRVKSDSNDLPVASTPLRVPDATVPPLRINSSTILKGKQSVLSMRSEANFYLDGYHGETGDFISQLMFICKQDDYLLFNDYIRRFSALSKLGEGTFGEVFQANFDGKTVALKVIPFVADDNDVIELNGDYTKPAENVIPELLISKQLSDLSENITNQTPSFVKVHDSKVVRGNWPKNLLKCWNDFKRKYPKKCLNTCPAEYMDPNKIYYLLIALGHGGTDLESVVEQKQLRTKEQVLTVLVQICLTLVIAESALEFEHRDLHWGNVLVKIADEPDGVVTYVYNDVLIQVRSFGYKASLIDFTNSRISSEEATIYLNLGEDKELFEAKGEGQKGGDYQFDIYRMMKESNKNEWSHFNPKSNCFWVHYLAKKVINAIPRFPRARKAELIALFDKVLEVDSLNEFIQLPEVDLLFKDYIVDE